MGWCNWHILYHWAQHLSCKHTKILKKIKKGINRLSNLFASTYVFVYIKVSIDLTYSNIHQCQNELQMREYTVEYNAQKSFYQAESNRSFELVSDTLPWVYKMYLTYDLDNIAGNEFVWISIFGYIMKDLSW